MSDQPSRNDLVWHHEYKNGYIEGINWSEGEVYVFFWRRTFMIGPKKEVFDIDLFDTFNEQLNQWWLL